MDDEISAIDHAIANYAVDPKRVGVYGGSYGGFMLKCWRSGLRTRSLRRLRLRPVADWKNYYASSPVYTAQRLGFPDKNPEAYKRSSPISYADGLKTKLLILHGIVDDNVHVEDSMQLTEKLIRLVKRSISKSSSTRRKTTALSGLRVGTDEYERIFSFL